MALFATEQERAARAAEEHAIKFAIEQPVAEALMPVFDEIADTFERQYANSGTVLNVAQFAPQIADVLNDAYASAFDIFGITFLNHAAENEDDDTDPMVAVLKISAAQNGNTYQEQLSAFEADVVGAYSAFTAESVAFAVTSITNTFQRELDRKVEQAVEDANKSFYFFKNIYRFVAGTKNVLQDIAAQAAANFRVLFPARSVLVAQTEIQNAAEGAKTIEAMTFQDVIDDALDGIGGEAVVAVQTKEWHTVGDDLVRDAHRQADLQRVLADDPFTVGGEQLMNPGDRSLGASPENTINCRCSAIYFVDGQVTQVITA